MEVLKINQDKCSLCRECIENCPFEALSLDSETVRVTEACRLCGVCVKVCPKSAISLTQKKVNINKSEWQDILVYVEQEDGQIHPVTYELIGEARRLAENLGYEVKAVAVGPQGTKEATEKLLEYGVDKLYIYEDNAYRGFRADVYANTLEDCIRRIQPSVVLIGASSLGRSLAPKLSTRFNTGLTADCTRLEMRSNSDLVQIRPAFGGNVMAKILVENHRPQFATVRYKVMDAATKVEKIKGELIECEIKNDFLYSKIKVKKLRAIQKSEKIEDEDILIVAGRGVKDSKGMALVENLARRLGGQVCFTRPMVEAGYGDSFHQIGLSGRTVRPKLIITCGVSGAIQFTSSMNGADCIVAINDDPKAKIFDVANFCLVEDLYTVIPAILQELEVKEEEEHALSLS